MEEKKPQPGMLTYNDECSECPAGLGSTVYVVPADGIQDKLESGELCKFDLASPDGWKEGNKDGLGFSVGGTAEVGEVNSELWRLLNPRVRLPRREKKRRLNNVMRHLQLKATILLLNMFGPRTGQMLALSLLFPDKLPQQAVVMGQQALVVSNTQAWLYRVLMRRLQKNFRRILFRDGGLRLVGRTTADGDASAEIVVTRQQAERLSQMLALEERTVGSERQDLTD